MTDQRTENRTMRPVARLLALLGPGLFLIGYNIGTGSVTTMAKAGSQWGMSLTWTVVLSCLFAYVGLLAFGRYTLVTGDTILCAIRKRFILGNVISLFVMGTLILAEIAGVTGLMAIIVDLLCEWTRYTLGYAGLGLKVGLTVALCSALSWILLTGSYQYLEKVLATLVAVMGLCFVATAVLTVPSWRDILAGLVPGIPDQRGAAMTVGAMVGTTFSAAMFYCRSIIIKTKGWGPEREKPARFDAVTSVVAMFILSIAVMICAAGTLYIANKPVVDTIDMVRTLEPLAGRFAITFFVVGIVGAGISSLIPTILIAPWLISDYTDSHINPKSKASRIFVVLGILLAAAGPFLNIKPVELMIVTMALLAVIVPLSIIAITILLNQKHMGARRNTFLMNVACVCTIAFSLAMSYFSVIGLIEKCQHWLG